jgi:uncharacterized protein (TIRG00374 family)
MKIVRKYLPFVISFVLIAVLVAYAPWEEIGEIIADLSARTLLGLAVLGLAYHLVKALRFWYILRVLKINQPLPVVVLSYMTAQPISILPGGEVFRSHALQRYTGVPVSRSIGQFTIQGILEGCAMAALMLIAALDLGTLRIVSLGLAVAVAAAIFGIRRGYMANFGRFLNRFPFINVAEHKIEEFSRGNREVFSRDHFPRLMFISFIVELIGTAIAYVAVASIGGQINVFQAVLFYTVPIIAGFVSLLPGGIGISEQSAVGILYLSKVPVDVAVAATLLMRVSIVGLGIVYGLLAQLFGNRYVLSKLNHAAR